MLLACLMIAASACAETGACLTDAGDVYFALNGLKVLRADGTTADVTDGEIARVFADGGDVYVLKTAMNAEGSNTDGVYTSDVYENTLYRIGADGAETQIGEPAFDYNVEEFREPDMSLAAYTTFNGYRDLTVYDGAIYYIGNDDVPGAYTTRMDSDSVCDEVSYETNFDCGAAVWRMNLDGSDPVMLISGLGNGGAHLAVANDRIAVSSCFMNAVYAFDFTNFMLYDLDGNLLKTVANNSESRHSWLYNEDCEFTVIVDALATDGETIYASLAESEGDFASSYLVNTENVDETLAIEAFFTPSKLWGDGFVCLTTDAETTFYEDGMENSMTLRFRSLADGSDRILAHVPAEFCDGALRLDVAGDTAYLRGGENLLRAPLNGGAVETWDGSAFTAGGETSPTQGVETAPTLIWDTPDAEETEETEETEEEAQYYLPDSDVRLYTRAELEQYDTETLGFMRNEILARHGYPFKKEMYRNYFESKSWYTRDEGFEYGSLNSIEMDNVETIKKIEESR